MGIKTVVKWEHDGPVVVRVLDNSRDDSIILYCCKCGLVIGCILLAVGVLMLVV